MASMAGPAVRKEGGRKIFTRITPCYNIKSMKILLTALIALFVFASASCSKDENGKKTAGEIATDYTKTLSSAPGKARDAGGAAEERDEKMTEAIKELDR